MSQQDYDQGYEDGRASRESEIDNLTRQYEFARDELERARAERQRLRRLLHRDIVSSDSVLPF